MPLLSPPIPRSALVLFLCVLLWVAPPAVYAQTIPGDDRTEFGHAVTAWLSGEDDLAALAALSELSQGGNTAAQMLLARIGIDPVLHQHVTDPLDRSERIALLRQPGGLSGRSWMQAAAETSAIAQAFVESAQSRTRAQSIEPLLEAGEDAVVMRALQGLLAEGAPGLDRAVAVADMLPAEAKVLLDESLGYFLPPDSYLLNDRPIRDRQPPEHALIWNPVMPWEWEENPETRQLVLDSVALIESHRPLYQFCETVCPTETPECAAAGAALLAGQQLFPFHSPVESVLPTETYWQSARITQDVRRRLFNELLTPEHIRPMSACLAETLMQ